MNKYQKVLVAVDIYAEYTKVLERALSIVHNPQHIHLVYASFPHMYFESYGYAMGTDFFNESQQKAKAELQSIAEQYGIPLDQVYSPVGDAANEIHALAAKLDIDVIVMGTHGRDGLKLLLGSTANAVLHGVKCDVLAVKV